MFLKATAERNPELLEYAFSCHTSGKVLPDTYLIDLDTLLENAEFILNTARENNVHLYYMLKQLGRNPLIARRLQDMGFGGAVCVDFREALIYARSGIKIGHAGHLTQLPNGALREVLLGKPEIVTVYSIEKARQINAICKELKLRQNIMVRVIGENDFLYPGQYGGFSLQELETSAPQFKELSNISLQGVTSFPCFLYDAEQNDILATENSKTVIKGAEILRCLGFNITQLNMPSVTCCAAMPKISHIGGTHAEPGNGLTGTTPYHASNNAPEKPAVVYVSEVTHNLNGKGYCLGGGSYSRGKLEQALVGTSRKNAVIPVAAPPSDNIDYHFELQEPCNIGSTVLMCFRTQMFVTRSQIGIVSGLSKGTPKLIGLYSSQGELLGESANG